MGGLDERRVLTVLFADLVDSTSLVESLDPEAARDLLSETFRRLAAEVRRFGGTLEKYIGDAIFAVFGYPTGHDDDAARAVRAALAMRDIVKTAETALGNLPLHLRIGLDTGEVAAGTGSGDLRVTGPAVHTAARIQQAAEPDQILLSARTLRAAGIELDPLRRVVTRDGRQLDLSVKEFAVLEALLRASPAFLSTEDLLEQVWDEHADPFTNTVTVTIGRLRRKLGDPPIITTTPSVGYHIAGESTHNAAPLPT